MIKKKEEYSSMLSIKTTILCSSHFFDIYKAKKVNLLIVKYSGFIFTTCLFSCKRTISIHKLFLFIVCNSNTVSLLNL